MFLDLGMFTQSLSYALMYVSMSESKVRIKLGEHEFEAEGPVEAIRTQLDVFKQLIAPPKPAETPVQPPAVPPLPLDKIMKHSRDVVSISISTDLDDAVLLMLLGQRHFRRNDIVSGSQIMNGLRQSGLDVPRVDMVLNKHARHGNIIATGIRRTRRYQLSVTGLQRAQQIARKLIPPDPKPSTATADAPRAQ